MQAYVQNPTRFGRHLPINNSCEKGLIRLFGLFPKHSITTSFSGIIHYRR